MNVFKILKNGLGAVQMMMVLGTFVLQAGAVSANASANGAPNSVELSEKGRYISAEMLEGEVLAATVSSAKYCEPSVNEVCYQARKLEIKLKFLKGCMDVVGPVSAAPAYFNEAKAELTVHVSALLIRNKDSMAALCEMSQTFVEKDLTLWVRTDARLAKVKFMGVKR